MTCAVICYYLKQVGWNVRDDNYICVAVIAYITCSRLSSGLDQKKRAFYAGTLALPEQNSEGRAYREQTNAQKLLSEKKKKRIWLFCALVHVDLKFLFITDNIQWK